MTALKQRSRSSYQNVIRFRDADGRPLGEGKLPIEMIAHVPMTLRTCVYAGSRFQHAQPMNLSALQQVRRHWDDCRGLLAWLRQLHLELTGSDRVTLSALWRIAQLGQSLPAWLTLRHAAPIADGALPPAIAVVFKVVAGLTLAIQSQHLAAVLSGTDDTTAAADRTRLIDHCETQGLLIGATEVCAGPLMMIAEILDLLIDGPREALPLPPCAATIGDGLGFVAYAAQAARFQAAGYVVDLFGQTLGRTVIDAAEPAAVGARAAIVRPAIETLRAGLSGFHDRLLQPALALPPQELVALARAVLAFMTGAAPDGTPTGMATATLIDTWCRPRTAAETALARLLGVDASDVLVSTLAAQLALEQHWLRLNRVGDGDLERALGHDPGNFPLGLFDARLGDTAVRRCLEALFDLTIAQDDDGARLSHGTDVLSIPVTAL